MTLNVFALKAGTAGSGWSVAGRGLTCVALATALLAAGPASVQTSSAQTNGATLPAPKPVDAAPVRPPVARQIVPMVAPVRRVAPATASASFTQRAPAATPASTLVPAKPSTIVKAAAPVGKAPMPAATVIAAAPAAVASAPAATARPASKFVAYTCKVGQDYSVERKTCFTPGVTKADGGGSRGTRTAAARPTAELGGRSSLGGKRKN